MASYNGMAMIIRRALLHAALLIGCTVALPAVAIDGLITRPSPYSVDATIEKFEAAAKKRGFVVFARLDHAAAAESVGLKMPRSTVIVFGNPRVGTPTLRSNWVRASRCFSVTRQDASATASWKTDFAKSTAAVVAFMSDSFRLKT
jgi:uncharacterized protein DUF302